MQGLRGNSTLLLAPREGKGEAAISNFVPFVGDPQQSKGEAPTSDLVHFLGDPRDCMVT